MLMFDPVPIKQEAMEPVSVSDQEADLTYSVQPLNAGASGGQGNGTSPSSSPLQ